MQDNLVFQLQVFTLIDFYNSLNKNQLFGFDLLLLHRVETQHPTGELVLWLES